MTHPILQGMTSASAHISDLAIEYAMICDLIQLGYTQEAQQHFAKIAIDYVPELMLSLHQVVKQRVSTTACIPAECLLAAPAMPA